MSIKLMSGTGWNVQLNGAGSLLDGCDLTVTGLNLEKNWNGPLNKIDPKDLSPGNISFSGSAPLPFAGSTLTISANQGATIGGQIDGRLFGSGDPFDQPLDISRKCCLWLKLNGTFNAGVEGTIAGFGIDIQSDSHAEYQYTRIFAPDAAGKFCRLSQAAEELFDKATPPVDLAALMAVPEGSIFEFDCGGSVTLTGSYSVPAATIPLATTTVPVLKTPLSANAAPSLGVSGSFELSGSFIFRIHKLSGNIARFQLFKKSGTEVEVSFSASAGIAGDLEGEDFLDKTFKAIVPDCKVDLASRDKDLNKQLADVLEDAVSSHLSACLNAEASISCSISHVFMLEIDLQAAAADPGMTKAVNGLFHGDWTIARRHDPPLACVKNYSDMLETATTSKQAFHFHLLNLFSFASVAEFLTSAKVLKSPDGVVFTDNETASHIQVEADGRTAKPLSLSKVLAQALQATLVFKTSKAAPALAQLSISGNYFTYEKSASKDDVHEIELLSAALDCNLDGLQSSATRVGVVKFDASSKFDSDASDSCFVGPAPGYTPKDKDEYIRHAKDAIASLYDPADQFHAAVSDDKLWGILDNKGNLGALSDPYVQGFLHQHGGYDGNPTNFSQMMWLYRIWYTVTYWAKAMAAYAQLLQKAKTLASRLPPGSTQQTQEIQGLMSQLSSEMHEAQDLENNFIDARAQFGLAALYFCSGKRAANDVCLTWNGVTSEATNQGAPSAVLPSRGMGG